MFLEELILFLGEICQENIGVIITQMSISKNFFCFYYEYVDSLDIINPLYFSSSDR